MVLIGAGILGLIGGIIFNKGSSRIAGISTFCGLACFVIHFFNSTISS